MLTDWIALTDAKSLNPPANTFCVVHACWTSCRTACIWASCNIDINVSDWIAEASSWTPSCHATMWTECDHPLAREPDWAKGISRRHANSTNAPVSPNDRSCLLWVFPVYFCMCVQHSPEREVCSSSCLPQMQLTLCRNSQASTIDVVWFLDYSVQESQAGWSVNTTQGQEVCHHSFPDRSKRTAGWESTMTKMFVVNQRTHLSSCTVLNAQLYTKESYVSLALFRSTHFVYAFREGREDFMLLK